MEAHAIEVYADISELIADYLSTCAARNLSPQTIRKYHFALDRFQKFYNEDIRIIDAKLLRRYILHLRESGLTPRSVHDYYVCLRIFFNHLVGEGYLPASPSDSTPPPRYPKRLPNVLSLEQSQSLLDTIPDYSWIGQRDKTAVFLLLGSGLRLSEMLSLNIFDVDLTAGEIRVVGKGSKERIVPIDSDVCLILKGWQGLRNRLGCKGEALFVNRYKQRMANKFGLDVKRYANDAGFFCTPHVLRHTFATNWIRSGGDIQRLKDILGHSHISMTEKYIHLARKDFREAVNKYSITKQLRFDSRQMSLMDWGE